MTVLEFSLANGMNAYTLPEQVEESKGHFTYLFDERTVLTDN